MFTKPEDQEVVAYYTSCNGSNVFSESLSVAYLQGTAASELLSSVNSVVFETACPDQVTFAAGTKGVELLLTGDMERFFVGSSTVLVEENTVNYIENLKLDLDRWARSHFWNPT